ncbi:hypothetical protein JN11_03923 [Mucilaginibacter frigoritolerans]|uniref:Uncharacterized protein n=1 Tax=Mucilaginibacter frigoritolerans TaxID=652788 RepID=A0A562TVG7_9SPHI|nr:hypothetical protein [Mucilaginibacter frigoritolerans]TWI96810.1 hypothetical protein JN11_03923 [Mucilaginibacter frigoritolerans]
MKPIKITKNQIDSKSIRFCFSTDNRHLNLNELMKKAFVAPQDPSTEINPITHTKNNKDGKSKNNLD